MTEEVVIPQVDRPEGTVLKGHEHFVVQDPIIEPRMILYRRECG